MSRIFNNGDKVENWTIIGYNKKKRKYECECVCGRTSIVASNKLTSGLSKSCGCRGGNLSHKQVTMLFSNYSALKNIIFGQYVNNAKSRNLSFDINQDFFIEKIEENCHYCNAEPTANRMTIGKTKLTRDYYAQYKCHGLDRIDNSIGYCESNVVTCCKICNHAKNNLGYEEWISWLQDIINHNYPDKL